MAGVSFDQSDRGLQSKSRLLNPDFPLIRTWRLLSTILLLYVAIVVQVQVGFFWYKPLCEPMPTEAVDIFIDCFFLLELVLNFLTGVWHDGIYHDRFAYVAWRYLHTSLLFDVITSFPIAIVEFAVRSQACKEIHADDSADGTNYSRLRLLRTLKPLRIFKLLRLLKAGKISSLIEAIDARLHLPVFMLRMLKIYLAIAFIVHTCVCLFWLVREATLEEQVMDEWLLSHGLLRNSDENLLHKYLIAWYFLNTIFSTVGFGDIVAEGPWERVVFVCFMYVGVIVFGTLLSEVQNTIEDVYHLSRSRARVVMEARQFMRDKAVPQHIARRALHWLSFDFETRQQHSEGRRILDRVPTMLQRSLHSHLHQDLLLRIPCLFSIQSFHRYDLMIDLFSAMTPTSYPAGIPVATRQCSCHKLSVLTGGTVLAVSYEGEHLSLLRSRDFFGEYGLLNVDQRYRMANGLPCEYFANSMVTFLELDRVEFDHALAEFPEEVQSEFEEVRCTLQEIRTSQSLTRASMKNRELIVWTKWIGLVFKSLAMLIDENMKGMHLLQQQGDFFRHFCQKLKFNLKGGWSLHWYGQDDAVFDRLSDHNTGTGIREESGKGQAHMGGYNMMRERIHVIEEFGPGVSETGLMPSSDQGQKQLPSRVLSPNTLPDLDLLGGTTRAHSVGNIHFKSAESEGGSDEWLKSSRHTTRKSFRSHVSRNSPTSGNHSREQVNKSSGNVNLDERASEVHGLLEHKLSAIGEKLERKLDLRLSVLEDRICGILELERRGVGGGAGNIRRGLDSVVHDRYAVFARARACFSKL